MTTTCTNYELSADVATVRNRGAREGALFYRDVMKGLSSRPKYLPSKYFYDVKGDAIFQEIMNCVEYYPFACELEIFRQKASELASEIRGAGDSIDLIELGAGDCTKSMHLLKQLLKTGTSFTYMPVDISSNIISYLEAELPLAIPGLKIKGLTGEYFTMLEKAMEFSNNRKVILFLGSNLGNMSVTEAAIFCKDLRNHLCPGDLAIIGLDLKKNPRTILAAYNDKEGITRRFNLNLLERINRELDADFDLCKFDHFPVYDPQSGVCKSYLVSKTDQDISIGYMGKEEMIHFDKSEEIFMEISQKYTVPQIGELAAGASFEMVRTFYDSRGWFADSVWQAI
jgi:dimethylhistidine N-methyltransferase